MNKRILFPLLASLMLQACLKAKVENVLQPNSVLNTTASSIRLFNFSVSNLDIAVNNNPLTSFVDNVSTGGTQLGLTLFPSGYWPSAPTGSPIFLPQVLLDKNGDAHVHIQFREVVGQVSVVPIDTILQNDPLNPKDYYVLDNDAHLVALDRNSTPPSQPQDIKIRVINLGQTGDPLNLSGAVTLTYADGTVVSPATSNIGTGVTGAYTEIPYGGYEFKLFLSQGVGIDVKRQLAELPSFPNYDPCGSIPPQEALFPRLLTYKPGGVYSLVITPNFFRYFGCDDQNTTSEIVPLNAYRVITEQDPGTNVTFARMQGVNGMGTSAVSFQIDGQSLGGSLAFGQPTDYGIFVQGTHQVTLLDAGGKTLVQKSITLYPYDNYALWAYTQPDGTPDVLFAACDMTGTIYASYYINPTTGTTYDDGTSGQDRLEIIPYAWETRFLNLSPDLPYATFTNDSALLNISYGPGDSTSSYAATTNMTTGFLPADNPYTLYSLPSAAPSEDPYTGLNSAQTPPAEIRAYSSTPSEVPGSLLTGVTPIKVNQGFIANPALYTQGYLPHAEPGSYTVALIGNVSASPGDPSAARLIVIKHNK